MNGVVVLLDTSGSMAEPIGHRRRIDVMQDILQQVLPTASPGTRLFSFASIVREIEYNAPLPQPGGSTALHAALQDIAPLHPRQVIVICDGQPDDRDAALAAARALDSSIVTYFAGDENDHAAVSFMHMLAWTSADGLGTVAIADLHRPEQLTNDLKLLLTGPVR